MLDEFIPQTVIPPQLNGRANAVVQLVGAIICEGKSVAADSTVIIPIALDGVVKTAGLANYGNGPTTQKFSPGE